MDDTIIQLQRLKQKRDDALSQAAEMEKETARLKRATLDAR